MLRLITIDLRQADMALFEAYEARVLALVGQHGGRLDMRVRALDGSSETHLLYFPDVQAYERYRADPDREAAQDDWRRCRATLSVTEVQAVTTIV